VKQADFESIAIFQSATKCDTKNFVIRLLTSSFDKLIFHIIDRVYTKHWSHDKDALDQRNSK